MKTKCRCETCLFWQATRTDETGDIFGGCHRHAPVPVYVHGLLHHERVVSVWPETENIDLCGDWKKGGAAS